MNMDDDAAAAEEKKSSPEPSAKRIRKSGDFVLSASLAEHSHPLRDVAAMGNDVIGIAEDRGMMAVWERADAREFRRRDVLSEKVHPGLVFCVRACGRVGNFPSEVFVSGGNDSLAKVWTAHGSIVGELRGHGDCVNSVSLTADERIVTGSWDGTARVWNGLTTEYVLRGHQHATEVLGLPTGEIVTASANKSIIVFRDRSPVKTIENAHDHAIRRLAIHPLGFASCGNDGFVKVWSNQGDLLITIPAHVEGPRDTFIYGLTVLTTGETVSVGEDLTARVFSVEGKPIQVIKHPGPVRGVAALPNGDFVTACADRTARIFTRDPKRRAPVEELEQFESYVNMALASNVEDIDVSTLPGNEALQESGVKDGAIKLINVGGKGMVYKWDAASGNWELVGEAVGRSPKQQLNGKEYDHVIDVFITEKHSVKLGFNKDDDPDKIAADFGNKYHLAKEMRDQVRDHVATLVDNSAVERKKKIDQREKERSSMLQIPSWRTGSYMLFGGAKAGAMKKKLLNDNASLSESKSELSFTDTERKTFDVLMSTVAAQQRYHVATISDAELDLLHKMLKWPDKLSLAPLDVFRALMTHQDAVTKSSKRVDMLQLVVSLGSSPDGAATKHMSIACKAMSNFCAKRIKTTAERYGAQSVIPPEILQLVTQALDAFAPLASSDAHVFTYVKYLYNLGVWFGHVGLPSHELYMVIASGLFGVLERVDQLDDEVTFYALNTIGSLGYLSADTKDVILGGFRAQLQDLMTRACASTTPPLAQLGVDLRKVFFAAID